MKEGPDDKGKWSRWILVTGAMAAVTVASVPYIEYEEGKKKIVHESHSHEFQRAFSNVQTPSVLGISATTYTT